MDNHLDVPVNIDVNIDNTILDTQVANNHIVIDVEDKFNKYVLFGDLDLESVYKRIKKDSIDEVSP